MSLTARVLLVAALVSPFAVAAQDQLPPVMPTAEDPRLIEVASLDRIANGVTTSPDGRMFVSHPQVEGPGAQVSEIRDGQLVPYPNLEAERRMLFATTGGEEAQPRSVFTPTELMAAQRLVRTIPVGEQVVKAILELVRRGRPDTSDLPEVRSHVAWGPGPRASQALMLAVRARALIDGRYSPSVEDVKALAAPVLRHRMALNFSARAEGVTVSGVIDRLCRNI